MSFIKYIIVRLINAFIIFAIVLFIASIAFNGFIEANLKAKIEKEINTELLTNPQLKQSLGGNVTAYEIWRNKMRRIKYKQYGLDKPLIVRILSRWIQQVTFQWGEASNIKLRTRTGSLKVSDIIVEALPRTFLLFGLGSIVVILVGIYIGLVSSKETHRMFPTMVTIWSLFSTGLPVWWVGMALIMIFSYQLGLFPTGGILSAPAPKGPLVILDVLYHLFLPLFSLVIANSGYWAYIVRNLVITNVKEGFTYFAKAKGISDGVILKKHVLKASSPSIVTMAGIGLFSALGGSLLCEIVFNWPGMGMLLWKAIGIEKESFNPDVPVLLGITSTSTILFLAIMLLLDLSYGVLDPRVRVGVMEREK